MRSRSIASISLFWCGVARLVNGKAARLRARRIRLEMTISDSGPIPRSHSPLVRVRLSRSKFIRGFLLSNQVSYAGSLFVCFGIDGCSQLLAQVGQLDHELDALR